MRTGKRTTQNTTHNPSREAAQCCKLSIHRLDNRAVRVSLLVSVCVCVFLLYWAHCKWISIQLEQWANHCFADWNCQTEICLTVTIRRKTSKTFRKVLKSSEKDNDTGCKLSFSKKLRNVPRQNIKSTDRQQMYYMLKSYKFNGKPCVYLIFLNCQLF